MIIMTRKAYRVSCSNGVLDSLTSDFVYNRKAGTPLFILHPCAVPQVFDPVLNKTGNKT